jgi:hypothetical protein
MRQMTVITWPEFWVCLALVLAIGFGGFSIGNMTGYDRGERDRDHWCSDHHQAAEVAPITERVYDPKTSACWPEPDTQPLRRFAAHVATTGRALADYLTAPLGPPAGQRHGPASPDAMSLAIRLQAERTELEITALADEAERQIGRIKENVRYDQFGPLAIPGYVDRDAPGRRDDVYPPGRVNMDPAAANGRNQHR